jgi:hypothetical protein
LRKEGYHVVRLTYLGEAKGEIKLDEKENTYRFRQENIKKNAKYITKQIHQGLKFVIMM